MTIYPYFNVGQSTLAHRGRKIYAVYTLPLGSGELSGYSDSLWPGRSEDVNPVWERFPSLVQAGTGSQQASYTMGNGSFLAVKGSEWR